MRSIQTWSTSLGIPCELRTFSKDANSDNYSYFLLNPPKSDTPPSISDVIICLHGTGNDAWFPQSTIISKSLCSGLTVVAANLPGHGTQDRSTLDCDLLGNFVDDLISELSGRGFESFFLWGQSLGAAAIIKFMSNGLLNLAKVKGATLVAMPLRPRLSWRSVATELLLPILPSFPGLVRAYGLFGAFPAFGWFRRQDFPLRLHSKYAGRTYIQAITDWYASQDWLTDAANVRSRILLIYGDLDFVASSRDAILLLGKLKSSELKFVPWENHFTIAASVKAATSCISWMQRSKTSQTLDSRGSHDQ